MNRVFVKYVQKTRGKTGMRANPKVRWRKLVLPICGIGREFGPRGHDNFCQQHRFGVGRLAASERHQIIDDPMRQPRVSLDFLDVGKTRSRVLSGKEGACSDDLESVSELVCNLSGNFANCHKPLAGLRVQRFVPAPDLPSVLHGNLCPERNALMPLRIRRTLVWLTEPPMSAVPTESKIAPGTTLVGKYKVTREIGRGGMAAVYEAEHMSLGKRIAVKVLAQELSASTIVIERFFREARAAASVKSPHIVDVYDSGRLEDGRPFIAMELMEGESLYDRMARVRLIDAATTVRVITHCAKGLMKAHAAGVIHRDLKPENIFIIRGEEGEEIAKLLDFGLAKFYAPVSPDEKTARLTREGAVFGTPAYMSPEQVKGQGSVDHRADLWALGCIAFECVIGRPVWNTDQGVAMTFAAIATGPIPVPSTVRPDLPPGFDDWFKKALQRDPDKRFQSAKELAEAIGMAFGTSHVSLVAPNEMGLTPSFSGAAKLDPYPSHPSASGPVQRNAVSGSLPQPAAQSGADLPLANSVMPQFRASPVRFIVSLLGLIAGVSASLAIWSKYLSPQVFTPTVMSSATVAPTAPAGSGTESQGVAEEPKWVPAFVEAQKLFASGSVTEALKKIRENTDGPSGAGNVGRSLAAQIDSAVKGTGPCKLAAIAHPRLGVGGNANRPSVVIGAKGAIIAWNDDHEQAGRDHAYSVAVDPMGRALSRPRDVTPEAYDVERPLLLAVGERTALLYWDKKGSEAGVRVRWLDPDGRIGGASILVGAAREGTYWPVMDRAPDGFWVAWQDARDKEGDDLFLRHLSPELETTGPEIRATDFVPVKKRPVSVWVPSIAVASNAIFVAYRVDRDGQKTIERMRVPLSSPDLTKGLSDRGANTRDRAIGDVKLVDEDKTGADAPAIACGVEGCFLAWQGDQGGAFAAMIDTAHGRVVWHKKFAPAGQHPAIGASSEGQVAITWFEAGRVRLAMLSRDGVGTPSVLGNVHSEKDQPRPSLVGARKGEWYVAWQDFEGTHTEVFAGRIVCK